MSEVYSFEKVDDGIYDILDSDDTSIGSVMSLEAAETLVGYLNAGEGTYRWNRIDELPEIAADAGMVQIFNEDDMEIALCPNASSAEGILSHLNRNN